MSPSPTARRLPPFTPLRLLTVAAAAVFALGAALGAPLSAAAHSVLVSSDPADGAKLNTLPSAVTLTFNEDIDPHFAQVIVNSGGIARKSTGVTVAGSKITAMVPADVTPGEITVLYRVTSADSHPVEGKIAFTVGDVAPPAATGSSTPAPGGSATAPSASASTAPTAAHDHHDHDTGSSDMGNAMMIVLTTVAAVVLVVVGVLLLRSERRRR